MIKSFFKVAFRTLWKDKRYSTFSILGLSVSIAFCLLMVLYLNMETTYDQHHRDPHNLYRLVFDNYDNMGPYATTPLPIGPALQQDFPEIEAMTRFSKGFKSLVRFNNNKFFETVSFVDTGFMNVFKMEFIYGNPETALSKPNQIILSESAAKKYFGSSNPVGKVLSIGSSGSLNSTVTAVFKDLPQTTHIRLDMGLPFSTFEKVWGAATLWRQMPLNYTYFRLLEGQSGADFVDKLPAFAERHVGKELANLELAYNMNIQPITDIHLYSHLEKEAEPNGNLSSLYLLATIALLVLIIAIINYINYATARIRKRAKEVGVRKVIGAGRNQLIMQFLLETFLIALSAALIAFLLAGLLIPLFNEISGKAFIPANLNSVVIYSSLAILVMAITIGAGIFPALFLTGFKPMEVLKGQYVQFSSPKSSRKILVTIQFATSVVLLIATAVVYTQMHFARQQFLPGNDEKVVLFQINKNINEKFEVLKAELLKQPGVVNVTAGSNMPTFYGDSWPVVRTLGANQVQTENYTIENDFIETLGYQLIAGRDLDKNRVDDELSGFIVNETAVHSLGFSSPELSLGNTIYFGSDNKKKGTIVGVVKDFHFQPLYKSIEPAIIQFSQIEWLTNNFIAARIRSDQFESIRKAIQHSVTQIDPNWIADVKFIDDNFHSLHQKDIQQGQIFGAFALLAILISCLGLLGLIALSIERRIKEIGIRKVLGASVSNIIVLLSKEYLLLISLGLFVAIPLAWFLMNRWLSNFAYRVEMPWWVFASASITVLVIASLTLSIHCFRAALANPVESLKTE